MHNLYFVYQDKSEKFMLNHIFLHLSCIWCVTTYICPLSMISEQESPIKMASKADMTPEEREAKEQEEFSTGPLRVLTDSVKNNTQVLINCRWEGVHIFKDISIITYFLILQCLHKWNLVLRTWGQKLFKGKKGLLSKMRTRYRAFEDF